MLSEIERFVNWVRWRTPEARTYRDYGYDLRKFASIVGDITPAEVSCHDIDHFIMNQSDKGLKPTTINRRLGAIRGFYDFLSAEGQKLDCPIIPRKHHLREPQRLPRPVREEDLSRFFTAIHSRRDRVIFLLMLRCGLRISETACLSLSDIYLTQPYPHLLVHGKGSRERNVYLSPQTERSLKEYLAIRPAVAVDFVFVGAKNTHLSSAAIHKRLILYREQSRVSITSHRLRHTFANDLLNAKVPITTIQKLLGHRWIETTQNYAMANDHQVREDYFAACERLDTWMQVSWEDTNHKNNAVKEKSGGLVQMKLLSTHASRPLSSGSSLKAKTDLLKQNHSWLVTELEQFHSLRQRNWRSSRVKSNTRTFWTTHLTIWRFLCEERNICKLSDFKRQYLLDYIASRLKTGHAASSVNNEIRNLHSFLVYLGDKGYKIPQSFLHIPSVKLTDSLPKHLTEDQIILLRTEFEDRIKLATPNHLQDAWLDCSIFLLLWQCGLRSGEVEDLRLEDLDLDNCMIAIHDGKGCKDRTVYITAVVIHALQEYLLLRSAGKSECVFLYRRVPLKRDFVYRRMKAAGDRVGVKLSPHRLRHTCATQLLNAGCRETSIQKYLGHKRLNTTMIYARLYDVTLVKEYFNAVR